MIDRYARTKTHARCGHCGNPLQPTVYIDGRADLACPAHGIVATTTRGHGTRGLAIPTTTRSIRPDAGVVS